MLGKRYDFDYTKMSEIFDKHNNVINYVQGIQTQILKKEDEAVKEAMVRYMKEYAEKYNKRIALFILEEEEVEKIIDLGIEAYRKIKKDDIE